MVGHKKKIIALDESVLRWDPWLEFRDRALEIEQRRSLKWVNISGVPDQEGPAAQTRWKDVISLRVPPELQNLRLRDPDNFSVGGLHKNVIAWEDILKGHPLEVWIRNWIRTEVNILDFSRPFEGVFKKCRFSLELPPSKQLPNHFSCRLFSEFISQEILNRLLTGAFHGK